MTFSHNHTAFFSERSNHHVSVPDSREDAKYSVTMYVWE
jgi:hypothetical protein